MKLRLHVIVIAGLLFLSLSSCKKEYIDKFNMIPGDTIQVAGYTDITAFQVHEFSNDTLLKASMKGDTIIIYWPTYKPLPATIKPTITLPDSATISPASGAEVAFKTGTAYKVTSGAGTSHNYFLKVDLQQPFPWWSLVLQGAEFTNGSFQTLGRGDFFIPDTAQTKVYLVSATDSTEYPADVVTATFAGPGFFVPMNVPAGLYDVKVVNGIHKIYNSDIESRGKLSITYPLYPSMSGITVPTNLHRNDTFVVRGSLLELMDQAIIYDDNSTPLNLEIKSTAIDRVVLKIPADLPLAHYYTIELKRPDGELLSDVINLTVN